jgi:RNA polymerase sigma-70 factor (ECF subfamily)
MWTSFHAALIGGRRWEEFDRVYSPVIRAWVNKYQIREAETQDVTQLVFMKLIAALPRYDSDRGPFRGWLFRVVQNEALSYLRRRARHPGEVGTGDSAVQERLEREAAEDLASDLSDLADRRRAAVDAIRARVEPRTWEMVVAFHGGMTAAEVADRFGTTPGAVHQAVHRVGKLARSLEVAP